MHAYIFTVDHTTSVNARYETSCSVLSTIRWHYPRVFKSYSSYVDFFFSYLEIESFLDFFLNKSIKSGGETLFKYLHRICTRQIFLRKRLFMEEKRKKNKNLRESCTENKFIACSTSKQKMTIFSQFLAWHNLVRELNIVCIPSFLTIIGQELQDKKAWPSQQLHVQS